MCLGCNNTDNKGVAVNIAKKSSVIGLIFLLSSCSKVTDLNDFNIEIKTKEKVDNILVIISHRMIGSCFIRSIIPLHSGGLGDFDLYNAKLVSSNEKVHFDGGELHSECIGNDSNNNAVSVQIIHPSLRAGFYGFNIDKHRNIDSSQVFKVETYSDKSEDFFPQINRFNRYHSHVIGDYPRTQHLFTDESRELLHKYYLYLENAIETHPALTDEKRKKLLYMHEKGILGSE